MTTHFSIRKRFWPPRSPHLTVPAWHTKGSCFPDTTSNACENEDNLGSKSENVTHTAFQVQNICVFVFTNVITCGITLSITKHKMCQLFVSHHYSVGDRPMKEHWLLVELYWTGKIEIHREKKRAPVPLCPPKIPHRLAYDRTRGSAMKGQRQTA